MKACTGKASLLKSLVAWLKYHARGGSMSSPRVLYKSTLKETEKFKLFVSKI